MGTRPQSCSSSHHGTCELGCCENAYSMHHEEGFKPACLRRSQRAAGTEGTPAEMIAAGYRGFTFLVCPVSGTVLNDEAAQPRKI